MNEYFIVANSNAAPVVSDESTHYVKGRFPRSAMNKFIKTYKHWCGLFAASLYESADAYHKDEGPLLCFRSWRASTPELRESWEEIDLGKKGSGEKKDRGYIGTLGEK